MMDASGTLWSTAELGDAVLAIDPATERLIVSLLAAQAALACGQPFNRETVRFLQDPGSGRRARYSTSRKLLSTIAIPHGAEGIAVSPDGETLFVCAHRKGVVHVFDMRTPRRCAKSLRLRGRRARPISCGAYGFRQMGSMSVRLHTWITLRRSMRPQRMNQIGRLCHAQSAHGVWFCGRRQARIPVLPRCCGNA